MIVCVKAISRASAVSIVASFLAVAAIAGCRDDGASAEGDEEDRRESAAVTVSSLDGALDVMLPTDMIVHSQQTAVMATTADGGFRLLVEHEPDNTVLRRAGRAKDMLLSRGWQISSQRYYEQAAELHLKKVVVGAKQPATRSIRIVRKLGRLLTCDLIAAPGREAWLGGKVRKICQNVAVTPPRKGVGDKADGDGKASKRKKKKSGASP